MLFLALGFAYFIENLEQNEILNNLKAQIDFQDDAT